MTRLSKTSLLLSALLVGALGAADVHAFCGFYVAQADSKLCNKARQAKPRKPTSVRPSRSEN